MLVLDLPDVVDLCALFAGKSAVDDHYPVRHNVDQRKPFENFAEEVEQEVVVVFDFHLVL